MDIRNTFDQLPPRDVLSKLRCWGVDQELTAVITIANDITQFSEIKGMVDSVALQEDSTLEDERKYWSRESCTHQTAGMGGPDLAMKPRKLERGRERLSRKRRDEIGVRKRSVATSSSGGSGESGNSSRRTSDDKRISSSDSGHLSPLNTNDGVITASLKIPVPSTTSLSLNLDDIPFIEDTDRQHITLGFFKNGAATPSESGVGSYSPPSRTQSATSSWKSTSPEAEPTLGSLSFPTTRQDALKIHSGYTRGEIQKGKHSISYSRFIPIERISKSVSSTTMSNTSATTSIPASISSIGGAVMRSKTADIERMLRLSGTSGQQQEFRRRRTREDISRPETQISSVSHRSEARTGFWKRRELISSEPKERRNLF